MIKHVPTMQARMILFLLFFIVSHVFGFNQSYAQQCAKSQLAYNATIDTDFSRYPLSNELPVQYGIRTNQHNRILNSAESAERFQQHTIRERAERKLFCAQHNIDPIWAHDDAHDVNYRCMVINFLNGGTYATQTIKASPLPANFKEDFGNEWFFVRWNNWIARDIHAYEKHFKKHTQWILQSNIQDHERAYMRSWAHYNDEGYREFIKTLSVYNDYLPEIAAQFQRDEEFAKAVASVCSTAKEHIVGESKRIRWQKEVQHVFEANHCVNDLFSQQQEELLVFQAHRQSGTYVDQRIAALKDMQNSGAHYELKEYQLPNEVKTLLTHAPDDIKLHEQCYGNQLQQLLHTQCIDLLAKHARIDSNMRMPFILDLISSAQHYNHEGNVSKASWIIDFADGLLSGIGQGVLDAANGILSHPIETAIALMYPHYFLAYQLSRVAFSVAEIGIVYALDAEAGAKMLSDYFSPINRLAEAINKKELSLRDATYCTARITTQCVAQAGLLRGLKGLCAHTHKQLTAFIAKNAQSAPTQFLATADGQIVRAIDELAMNNCPPSCVGKFKKLEEALKIQEFTSVVKVTKHGIQRLIERGFEVEEVIELFTKADVVTTQIDGAKIFVKNIGNNKYNFIAFNQNSSAIITALKGINQKSLINLGKNYGWKFEY